MADAPQHGPGRLPGSFVATIRDDLARRAVGAESVIWSPVSSEPVALDPIATVMFDVIDGVAKIDELVTDVEDIIGVPREVADAQVRRVIAVLDQARALTTSEPDPHHARRGELFVNPPST